MNRRGRGIGQLADLIYDSSEQTGQRQEKRWDSKTRLGSSEPAVD